MMEFGINESGYIFVIMPNGEKRYILVDVPDCPLYGLLKLGEPIEEVE